MRARSLVEQLNAKRQEVGDEITGPLQDAMRSNISQTQGF